MTLHRKIRIQDGSSGPADAVGNRPPVVPPPAPGPDSRIEAQVLELEMRPRRNPILHWIAFGLSLVSLIMMARWVLGPHTPVPPGWYRADIVLGVVFAIEFFTRSGFRWGGIKYIRTRLFDFVAIVPVLAIVQHGIGFESFWVWLVLISRAIRCVDRFLGDGFVQRNALALLDGFEEEITDRVLERITVRLQADMARANFSGVVAGAFVRNRATILARIRETHPRQGVVPGLARAVGLDAALERAEEQIFDAVVGVLSSDEIDRAVREAVNSTFVRIRAEIARKEWRQRFHIRSPWTKTE